MKFTEDCMYKESGIALITGGSRGLGKNAALALSRNGVDVIITYLNGKEDADAVVREIEKNGCSGAALQLDVGKSSTFGLFRGNLQKLLKEKWNRESFDYLVNNAGYGINVAISETTEAQFDGLMNVHFKGVFFLTQSLLPVIADNGGIVNFSTGLSRFCLPGYGAYASMKGAIETFTKYLAKELGPRGIRVNVVAPGAIDTDFNKPALHAHPEMKGFISSQTALGRMGEPDDIGGVVAALCSDAMGWVTAQRVESSGGMFL
jgi:NAD(P)-dependent dehydrogenase (short-subunit alcohol dehydrogenase family)